MKILLVDDSNTMRRLLTALDSPQDAFRSIHVVGTNGKSSTVRMTASIVQHHGLRTGAYLSPHLVSFAERIRLYGLKHLRDADKARETRRRLLDMAAGERAQVAFYHAPFPATGYIARAGSGYEFVPAQWSSAL